MNKANENLMYRVCVIRQDKSEPIYVLDTDLLEQAVKCYRELDKEWVTSVEEKRPFRLGVPYMTSFSPALCVEIMIDKMSFDEYQQINNPYNQQMQDQGFTGFMQNNFKQG